MISKRFFIALVWAWILASAAHADETIAAAADPAPAEQTAFEEQPRFEDETQTEKTIGKGRSLNITVYREPDLSGSFKIDEKGYIAFPLLGNIAAENRTTEDLKTEIVQSLRKFIIDPQVSIAVEAGPGGGSSGAPAGTVNAFSVTVLGEVRQPGTFEIGEDARLTLVVAEAGGFTPVADPEKVKLIRKDAATGAQLVTIYNVEAINNGESEDPLLIQGDKIIVPQEIKDVNTAAILGEVKSAGVYEVTPGFTLMRLVARAGGFTPLAATNKIRVVRQSGGGDKEVLLFNASPIINGQTDDPEMKPGDMVFVPESFF